MAGAILIAAAVGAAPAKAESVGYVTGGLGGFDILHNYTAAEGRLEFRFAHGLFFIKPGFGTLFTNKGSLYTYFSLRGEIPIGRHVMIIPMEAIGDYEKGSGKNLGAHVEFKSGIEVDYVFDNGLRVGPVFDHISNAGIGRANPGEENMLLMVSVPLGAIFP
jgi:lipid A 3-O-deacylase